MRVAAGQLSMFYMHLLIVNEGEGNGKGSTYERAYFSESLHKLPTYKFSNFENYGA